MAYETSAILRSLLYQIENAETLDAAKSAVKAMCQKDDIAAVNALLAEDKEKRTTANRQ